MIEYDRRPLMLAAGFVARGWVVSAGFDCLHRRGDRGLALGPMFVLVGRA